MWQLIFHRFLLPFRIVVWHFSLTTDFEGDCLPCDVPSLGRCSRDAVGSRDWRPQALMRGFRCVAGNSSMVLRVREVQSWMCDRIFMKAACLDGQLISLSRRFRYSILFFASSSLASSWRRVGWQIFSLTSWEGAPYWRLCRAWKDGSIQAAASDASS